jgi:hypothetical protein
VKAFGDFINARFFNIKIPLSGGKTELEMVLATLFDGEVLAVVVLIR